MSPIDGPLQDDRNKYADGPNRSSSAKDMTNFGVTRVDIRLENGMEPYCEGLVWKELLHESSSPHRNGRF